MHQKFMHEFAWVFLAQLSPLNFTSFPSFCFASFIFLFSFLLPLFPFVEFKLDIVTKIYRLRSMKRILARKSVRTFSQLGWLTLWTNDSFEERQMELFHGARWESWIYNFLFEMNY